MTVLFIFKLIDGGSPFKWLDQNVQGYAHHFILGMVIYFLVKSLRENMKISPLFLLIALALTQDVIRKDQSDLSALLLTLSVIAISISSFIEVPKFFSNQVKLLGLASYPIYLLHTHLGSALCNIFASRVQNEILTLSFALVILTLTSIIIARYIELPAQRYLKSFLN
jgi:peptidoglycan/LPS O-acetylase OafA/YrhL